MEIITTGNKAKIDLMWKNCNETGLEHLFLMKDNHCITANSIILTMRENAPVRVWYKVYCDLDWKVNKFDIHMFDDNYKNIILVSDCKGNWETSTGESVEELKGCIDIDISATPFTNTIPIKRLSLKTGESKEIKVVYVDVYNFSLRPVSQRYTCLEAKIDGYKYRYENIDSGFMAEFWVDTEGFVIDYPDLFKRIYNIEI
ncbi:putative glycolipid-binding domain-containing protein [Clostridium sp. OS1-26]|uniref:putative glycolipid-binding domain-containing protein n=1 Tax=Clostridium sp. OS1-26 TaxID=3070681 RepID=UPI0027E0795C|nr:putative glycolipid-binding domain-containing protein [Clostridium sp. OS1-26]WML37491.1 putative glycolipid-binding domain-containing protein [Clostridium sp. OS1-26]